MHELVVATTNPGKFEEIRATLAQGRPNLKLISSSELSGLPKIVEDGSTFLENAKKKAMIVSSFAKRTTLADDSGLEVKVLGGRPGVLSARFAGPHATDEENIRKLLEKLKDVPEAERKARFRCAMVLCAPNGKFVTAVGDVDGTILKEPRGSGGFGYDPIFLLPEIGRSMAELTPAEKNRVSHRAKALSKIEEHLKGF